MGVHGNDGGESGDDAADRSSPLRETATCRCPGRCHGAASATGNEAGNGYRPRSGRRAGASCANVAGAGATG